MDNVQHIKGFFAHHDVTPFLELPWKFERYFKRWVFGLNAEENIPLCMADLIYEVEANMGIKVFSVFCNLLKTGDDYVPYHADKYPFKLLTVSLGASRDFYLKSNYDKTRIHYELSHGDVFIFPTEVNNTHKHSVPARTNVKDPRVSILFFYH